MKKIHIRDFLTYGGIFCNDSLSSEVYLDMSNVFDWRTRAACRDKDPELFFPVGNTGLSYQQIEEAKLVCRSCKVSDSCLRCALETNQDYGVWGGLSEEERRSLKRRAMRARRHSDSEL